VKNLVALSLSVSCTKVRKSLDDTLWMQKEQTFPLRP
jgi:hypothetical protein